MEDFGTLFGASQTNPATLVSGKKLTNTALVNELLQSMVKTIANFDGDMRCNHASD